MKGVKVFSGLKCEVGVVLVVMDRKVVVSGWSSDMVMWVL